MRGCIYVRIVVLRMMNEILTSDAYFRMSLTPTLLSSEKNIKIWSSRLFRACVKKFRLGRLIRSMFKIF
jgi:hypothetical protein